MLKLLTLTFLVAAAAGSVPDIEHQTQKLGTKVDLIYLGSVDGKSYYYQDSEQMSWMDAQQFCKNSGKTLASIYSTYQLDVLNKAHDAGKLNERYWINARDARSLSQFVYDHDESTLWEGLFQMVAIPPLSNCLNIYVNGGGYKTWTYSNRCDSYFSVLCEENHGLQELPYNKPL